ncbi:MAG: hypothetical protein IKM31_06590 [Oscillospiraceae bacterium]|nr:hypothetical protein [Oscillospiraceae bacterium]
MTKTTIKRLSAIAVFLYMTFTLLLAALPVRAAGYSIDADLIPGTVAAGERFVIRLDISGGAANTTEDYTVDGIGGLSGSDSGKVTFDAAGKASVTTGSGDFTYGGSGSTSLYVTVGGESKTVRVSGFEETEPEDDEPVAPSVPAGSLIAVAEGTPLPKIRAGETKVIEIPLTSTTFGRYAGKTQITASLPDGVYFNSATSMQELNFTRTGGDQILKLNVMADPAAKSGVCPITLTSVYKYSGMQVEEVMQVNLRIDGSGASAGELLITDYALDRKTVKAGETFPLTVYVRNTGSTPVENVRMQLNGLSTAGITVNGGMDVQYMDAIASNGSSKVIWPLMAAENMITGNQMLEVSLICGDRSESVNIFIPVEGRPAGSEDGDGPASSKPRVVIDSYTFRDIVDGVVIEEVPSSVQGGKTFRLTLTLKNTSTFANIENLKMTVSSAADDATGGVFTPANSSNTFFIANVGAGQIFTETIDLLVKADAPPKSYGLDVAVSYEAVLDGERVTIDDRETITIPVTQPDRFEVEEVNVWGPVMYGETIYPSISFVNKGKSSIYNLSIRIEGENFTTGEATSYIGNVESGSGDYYEANLNPEMPGMVEGVFILSYEDAAGNLKEVERPFSVEVQEMIWEEPIIDDPAFMEEPVEAGMPVWGWILIGVGGAAVIVVTVIIIRKAKKRKAAKALEDEDDLDD